MKVLILAAVAAVQLSATTLWAQCPDESYEPAAGVLFDEAAYLAGTSVLNQFTNVFVVNKAASRKGLATAQTIRLFTEGKEIQLAYNKISSGAEIMEIPTPKQIRKRKKGKWKGTTTAHCRHTTRGFYSVKRVEAADYKSGESQFHMPYAIFFNDKNGLALHEVPTEFSDAGHSALGSRASSGCVRVHRNTIPSMNQAVRDAGKGLIPAIDIKTGLQEVDDQGNPKMVNGWKSIVIVQEVNE